MTVGINLKNIDAVLDYCREVFVKKFERADAQCKQRQAFQEFEGADQTQATAVRSSFSHLFGPRLYIKKQTHPCCVRRTAYSVSD